LKRWSRQGREIRFYLTHNEYLQNTFEEATGEKNSMDHVISQGGNVLNSAWSIGLRFFKSSVYMALGNDLSYSPGKTLEDRRNTYYADGDYSTNAFKTGTGRDEAKSEQSWGGFRLKRKGIYTGKFSTSYDVELDVVHTTQTLWVYKIWLEANVLGNAHKGVPYHYYNCSEAGISGVMCRDDSDKGFAKDSNWYLMDEVCKRWKTRMFEDAIKEFVKAKEVFSCPEGILRVAQPAKGLVLQS
jgi:hypothetical protein